MIIKAIFGKFSFILRDPTNRIALITIGKKTCEQILVVNALAVYDKSGEMKSANSTITFKDGVTKYPVVEVAQELAEIAKLDVLSVIPFEIICLRQRFNQNDEDKFIEQKKPKFKLDGRVAIEWCKLFDFLNANNNVRLGFVDNFFAKLLQTPTEFLLQVIIQQLFVSGLFAQLISEKQFEVVEKFISDCVCTIISADKEQTSQRLEEKFQEKVVEPLFELLSDWQKCSGKLSLPVISSVLFTFSRAFWKSFPVITNAPNVQLISTQTDKVVQLTLKDVENVSIVVPNWGEFETEYYVWHRWICHQDRVRLYQRYENMVSGDKVILPKLDWEKNWIFEERTFFSVRYWLPSDPFQPSDPICKQLWNIIDDDRVQIWMSGGAVSRGLRNFRGADDKMSDIDLYVLFSGTSGNIEQLFANVRARIQTYLETKFKGKKILAFKRGNVYTIHIQDVPLPLQITFAGDVRDISQIYRQFDISHVYCAFSIQKGVSRWCANVYSWMTNIYEESAFLMHSGDEQSTDASRLAKIYHVKLSLANHAFQWSEYFQVLNKNIGTVALMPFYTMDERKHASPITANNAVEYLSKWRKSLSSSETSENILSDTNDSGKVMKKRRLQKTDGFRDMVTNRFYCNSRGSSQRNMYGTTLVPDSWKEPGTLQQIFNCEAYSVYDLSSDYELVPKRCREQRIGLSNIFLIPIISDKYLTNAAYLFGDPITNLIATYPKLIQSRNQRENGQFSNCIFSRFADAALIDDRCQAEEEFRTKFDKTDDGDVFLVDIICHLKDENDKLVVTDGVILKKRVRQSCLTINK